VGAPEASAFRSPRVALGWQKRYYLGVHANPNGTHICRLSVRGWSIRSVVCSQDELGIVIQDPS